MNITKYRGGAMVNWIIRLGLLLSMLALVACGGAEQRKAGYFEKGKNYLQQKDYDKALLEFRNVLQIDPKFGPVHFYLGKTNESLARYKQAYAEYSRAVELDPRDIRSLVGMGRIQLWARAPDRAIEFTGQALAIDALDCDALVVRAGARFQQDHAAEALQDVRKALDVNPDHVASLALLSRIYVQQEQADKAEALIKNALQRQPDSDSLIMLLAQLYSAADKYEPAGEAIQKLIDRHPEDMSFRMQKVSLYRRMQDNPAAEKELRKLVTDFPDSLAAKRSLINFLAKTRDLMFAQVELASLQKKDPDNADLKLVSAQLYTASRDYPEAEEIYREIIGKYDERAVSEAQYQLALLMLGTDRTDQARPLLGELLSEHPRHVGGLMLRGRIALQDGNAERAVTDFRTVLKEQPTSEQAMRNLFQAYLLGHQSELAQQQLQQLVELKPLDLSLRLELGKMLFNQGQFADAIEQLTIVSRVQADNFVARDLLFKCYLSSGDYAQATAMVDEIKRLKPDQALAEYYHGLVLQGQEKYDAAIGQFSAALEKDADAIEPLNMLVRSALQLQQPQRAIRQLDKIISRSPQHVAAHNLKGEVEASEKQYKKAIAEFNRAIKLNPEWWIPYRNLAGTYLLLKQSDKAMDSYLRGIDHAQQNQQLVILLAGLYEREDRVDRAIALYEESLRSHPEALAMANNLALLLAEYGKDQASRQRAQELVKMFADSQDPAYLDTRGWVYYRQGDYDRSLQALQQADKLAPNQLLIQYHLGSVYFSKGDSLRARQYLQPVMDADVRFRWRDQVRAMLDKINQQQALSPG